MIINLLKMERIFGHAPELVVIPESQFVRSSLPHLEMGDSNGVNCPDDLAPIQVEQLGKGDISSCYFSRCFGTICILVSS
jgi:hypothetical protein